jgi:hypothetical protein
MKNLKTILFYSITIGILLIASAIALICLSWVMYKSGNFLFLYFDIHFQFNFTYTLVSLTIITVLVVLSVIIFQSKKSSSTSSSKAWQYEEDYRQFNDYMGDDYFDDMDDPY